ncbi:transcriptional regulator, AraC family [Novosphingobium aromaticivorans DSM 12444]|uniref:Transcriptional regulator, AraC family n=1 Tax=Novosphingobium aromaticivorans (strain ATCC 700278 / DSM 12444 / CCUG 56034 / CIP 105152 / NBRC 16084 / F199) TaxID=279238 RepID=Q2G5C9_NOVAD|nr:AraC family transcriptional regulator ligand-binding domain-containing protein [Novosphingobium aromaticivorans]ABD26944.1 transcriptional regulator, AraC family [Novosphingobium aromaticivorans DSM 12444]SCY46134.1 transcriptional regulator, AraC family [Novosphingobium aromaticivorans]
MTSADNILAHASAMRQFSQFAGVAGLDLRRACPPDVYAFVEQAQDAEWLPATAHVDVLQAAAIASGRADLGVAFAMWCNIRGFGPVSLLWDHCTTVDEASRITRRYMHLESAAMRSSTDTDGHEAALRHILMVPARFGGSQFLQATLALQLRIIRMLLGEEWTPIRLELDHPAPPSYRYHQAVFRCPIEFEADRCALVFRKSDLHRPSLRGNANMVQYLERQLAHADSHWPGDLVQQIRYFVAANLTERKANLAHVSGLAGLSSQSLQRRLAERGTTFATILEEVRKQTADEYFRTARRPNLTELSHRLGYTDASAASRFLRQHMSTGARALMAQVRPGRGRPGSARALAAEA